MKKGAVCQAKGIATVTDWNQAGKIFKLLWSEFPINRYIEKSDRVSRAH
jgi:hypothetical protein